MGLLIFGAKMRTGKPNIPKLTATFFAMYFLMATQVCVVGSLFHCFSSLFAGFC